MSWLKLSALIGGASLIAVSALAKTPEPPGLFSPLPGKSMATLPQQAIAGKSRAVTINYGKLEKGRIYITLPGGPSYEAVRTEHQDLGKGRFTWVGHASDDPGNTVVIGVSGKAVAGAFTYHGKLFKLEPRANGQHVLSEVDPKDPAPELDPLPVADTTSATTSPVQTGSESAGSSGSVIDVLVAYTPVVQAFYGGADGADALIIQAVAETNKAYSYSKMTTRLNLVDTILTNYVESNDIATNLSRLRSTNDGYMDELHALRESYGADLVSLISNETYYCGYAYRMASMSASFASYAFSVIHHSCATGRFSFAHEIGHNQGANHDAANATGSIFPYAYGYRDPYNTFRTVMAYDCPGGCPRWPFFSAADNSLMGLPTGIMGAAENSLAIDQTAPTVAAFRQSATQLPPDAIADLSAIGVSVSQIDLNWTDTLNDEDNFHVERSGDGVIFTHIATLPANASSYSDTNLSRDVLYSYRIRASNSSGYSAYSNVAVAATRFRPPGC
jgi:hypothetical protein